MVFIGVLQIYIVVGAIHESPAVANVLKQRKRDAEDVVPYSVIVRKSIPHKKNW